MSPGRARRLAAVVGVIALLQVGAVLVYRRVERSRAPGAPRFVGERLSGAAAPELELERPDGRTSLLSARRGKWVLVHFWATWCPPCREELPGLLALGERLEASGRFELLAISVDADWAVVREFFAGEVPAAIVRARDPEAHLRYGAATLPDTYLVGPAGQLLERFGGARDWRTPEARSHLVESLR